MNRRPTCRTSEDAGYASCLGLPDFEGVRKGQTKEVLIELPRFLAIATTISVVMQTFDAHQTVSNALPAIDPAKPYMTSLTLLQLSSFFM